MAAANVRNVMFVHGRLAKDPTDLSAAFPHGGTALGLFGAIHLRLMPVRGEITAEEFHGQVYEVIEGATNVIIGATLREWDNDAVSALFPGTTLETASGFRSVALTETTQRGALGSSRAVKLIFSPTNKEHHLAVILYRAVPLLKESTEASLSRAREFGLPVMFLGLPDGSSPGRIHQVNRLEDLDL